jgi:hypothetical protein
MLVIIPIKHAPDLIKAWVSISSLLSTFVSSQLYYLVRSTPFRTESNLNRRIADALGKFAYNEKALTRRLRSLPARRPALAMPGVT